MARRLLCSSPAALVAGGSFLSFAIGCAPDAGTRPDPGGAGGGDAMHTTGLTGGAAALSPPPPGGTSSGGTVGTGGSPASAGVTGAGGTRRDAPDAEPPGSTPSLALSDDFESGAPGGPPDASRWSVVHPDCSGSGTLSLDGSVAHGGKQSLRVAGGGGYCDHVFISNTAALAALGQQVFARFYVRFASALGDSHVSFLSMKDTADGGKNLRMGGQSKILMYNRESDDATLPALGPIGISKSIVPGVSTWTCLELHVDEERGRLDTWVDGKEIAGLVVGSTPVPEVSDQWMRRSNWKPSLADFKLGWESYAGQTMTLWLDDVALAGQRIGCGNP